VTDFSHFFLILGICDAVLLATSVAFY